ncbi:response regulator [Haloplanus sp. C73]|uniref:response regulator n=1 Tax=Haloplanus sp. C73 TaxID=3421641 RepID=UPI003EBB97BE
MPTGQPTVLLVDDEPDIVDIYALAFSDAEYAVERAHDGEAALEAAADADVILLDRRMPGLSGEDVLTELRERELDVRVAMVTAVDPDFDIAEMPFDAYLTKPVSDEELRETVDTLLALARYDEQVRERYVVAQKLAMLEAEKTRRELEGSEEYASLRARAAELDAAATETVGEMTRDAFERALSGIVEDGIGRDA